jgi:DNA-binding LacI/PurR family transcriptional regulator
MIAEIRDAPRRREGAAAPDSRMQRVADFILISTRSDNQHGRRLTGEIHVPTVLIGSSVARTPYGFVTRNDLEAGFIAARKLLDLGHRHIVVIGGRKGSPRMNYDERAVASPSGRRGSIFRPIRFVSPSSLRRRRIRKRSGE